MSKIESTKLSIPKKYPVNKPNGLLNAVLTAFGTEFDVLADSGQIELVKDMVFLETAESFFLDRLGNNYGIKRPRSGLPDANFRDIIRHIAFQPKSVLKIIVDVLGDLFGPTDGENWDVFSVVPGEIIVVLRDVSTPRELVDATYIHGNTLNFEIQYTGAATDVTVSIEPEPPGTTTTHLTTVLRTKIAGVDDLVLDFVTFPTVDVLAAAVNAAADYTATHIR